MVRRQHYKVWHIFEKYVIILAQRWGKFQDSPNFENHYYRIWVKVVSNLSLKGIWQNIIFQESKNALKQIAAIVLSLDMCH